jgi:hypothetical protein
MDRPERVLLAVVIALTAMLMTSACAPDSTYLTTSSQGMYFKIPHAWRTCLSEHAQAGRIAQE